MQALARNGWSAADVKGALHAPSRRISFRYDLLDSSNKYKRTLNNVTDASVSVNTEASIKRTAKFSLVDDNTIDFGSDRIKPYVLIKVNNPTYGLTAFSDNFIGGIGAWETYGSGVLSASSIGGLPTAKKSTVGDPNGGFRRMGRKIYDFDMSAYLYRENIVGGGTRVGLENLSFNGYTANAVYNATPSLSYLSIDRRDNGAVTVIAPNIPVTLSLNQWYTMRLVKKGATLTAYLYNGRTTDYSNPMVSVSVADSTHQTFDIVCIRGGYEYHVGGINVVDIKESSYAEFPMGVFLLSTPIRRISSTGVITRDIEAYDQCQVLTDDKVTNRYRIVAGTGFITAIGTILTSAGITNRNLTASSLSLPIDREWDFGTPKLDIINELLSAMNYDPLHFDEDGVAIARPHTDPDLRASEYTYVDDLSSVMGYESEEVTDYFGVPNQFVLIVSQPERAELKSIYTNANASSPTSTVSRGRTIVDPRQVDAPDQTTLDSLARTAAYRASQVYQTLSFPTAIMPIHSVNDVFTVTNSMLNVSAKFEEIGWSMQLKAGATMNHTVRRVVTV